ncbi:MAG TPA: S-layer homology domain-containing protein, partial [Thermomicrobiales bacterium]
MRVLRLSWRLLTVAALCLSLGLPALRAPQAVGAFPDVSSAMSCDTPIRQLITFGVLRGYPDGTFGPHDPLLRAQAAAILVRGANWSSENPQRTFSDQGSTDDELWRAVRILADRDVATGFPDGTFGPAEPLSRQEALSFVTRLLIALGSWQQQGGQPFGDVAESHASDVGTYLHYVGAIPQVEAGSTTLGAGVTADRCWYAEAFWGGLRQLDRYQPHAGGELLDTPTPLYWGAYINGSPWDQDLLNTFESRAGKSSSLVHWGQAWSRDGQYQPFQADMAARVRSRGAIPLIDWGSWDVSGGPEQGRFGLAGIARGEHDAYLRSWAAAAAAWGQPLFLRFNWEMNG